MAKKAVVVLAPGFEDIEAITIIDVLRRAGVEVKVASVGNTTVESAHGVPVTADLKIDAIKDTPDAIILPGGLPGSENLGKSKETKKLAEAVAAAGGLCAAICAAPALTLGQWGLLDGKTATCYPSFEKQFPVSVEHSEDRVVVDGKVVTSRGPGTALEFALTLVEILVDSKTAGELQQGMLARA
ncbi:MAG: DJ-1/PfpI family protein [Planctomycetes bacterium]|nr:DJ-1/PfpI family protein [Planctomycetota bacterium]